MKLDHPKLASMLERVLGGDMRGSISAAGLKLYASSAIAELRMKFEEGNIPPNFQKKARNCLVIFLSIDNFRLMVSSFDSEPNKSEIEEIAVDRLTMSMGNHRYKFEATSISILHLLSVDEMDHAEERWEGFHPLGTDLPKRGFL